MDAMSYFAEVRDIVSRGNDAYLEAEAGYNKIMEDIKSGAFSADHVSKELYPEASKKKRIMNDIRGSVKDEVRKLTERAKSELAEFDRLDPGEITEDAKLLDSNFVLTKNDLVGILDRNQDNRTMIQLVMRYAEKNNLDLDGVHYQKAVMEANHYDDVCGAVSHITNWYGSENARAYQRVWNLFLEDGSEAYNYFKNWKR